MGSKKLRAAKQAAKPVKASAQTTAVKKPTKVKPFELESSTEPLYKALLMVFAVLVLALLLDQILNSAYINIVSDMYPDIVGNSVLLREKVEEYMYNNMYYPALQRITLELAGILAVCFFFKRIEKNDLSVLGFTSKQKIGSNIGMGLLFGFLAVLITFNLIFMFNGVDFTGKVLLSPIQLLWLLEILLMIMCEELVFRGYLRYKFSNVSPIVMYIISSALYALYKGFNSSSLMAYLPYLVMNFFFMFTYIKLNSPWFNISFRFMWSFISGLILPIYSPLIPGLFQMEWKNANVLTGVDGSVEKGLIVALVFVLAYFGVKFILEGRLKPGEKHQRRLYKDGTIR